MPKERKYTKSKNNFKGILYNMNIFFNFLTKLLHKETRKK